MQNYQQTIKTNPVTRNLLQRMKLNDSVIWLTGASSGIGRALAIELAKRGAKLAISARGESALQEVCSQITAGGVECRIVPCDVSKPDQINHSAEEVIGQFGRIDMMIANAGTHIETWPEKGFKSEEYIDLMNLNFGSVVRSFGAVLPHMLQKKAGTLVAISSLAGYRGVPQAAAYGASKAAISNFVESIRFHLRPCGIHVVLVNPGFVKTPLTDKNRFGMPFLISAERAANYIADGLSAGKITISFPFPFSSFMALMRCLPYSLYDLLLAFQWKRILARQK